MLPFRQRDYPLSDHGWPSPFNGIYSSRTLLKLLLPRLLSSDRELLKKRAIRKLDRDSDDCAET